jgi:hypothetical protein
MSSRRYFLSLFALGSAAALEKSAAYGAIQRRFRRRSPICPPSASERIRTALGEPEFIQPDYSKWQRVRIGMPRDEVLAILGKPLHRDDETPEWIAHIPEPSHRHFKAFGYSWSYGHLKFADPRVPNSFDFSVHFRFSTQTVRHIYDPFDGTFSVAGEPTIPRLVLPQDKSVWEHNPRFLDLRWTPSAGGYPMQYEIESGFSQIEVKDDEAILTYQPLPTAITDVPHHALSFVGAQKGRWRVRAKNRHGLSGWTDYRYFEFKH